MGIISPLPLTQCALHVLALPGSTTGLIDSSSPPSPSSSGALSSSTGANSGLTGSGPIVVRVVPAQVLSGPASENSTHPLRQLVSLPASQHPHVALSTEVCDLLRLVDLDESLVLTQVDLISGLCHLGNA